MIGQSFGAAQSFEFFLFCKTLTLVKINIMNEIPVKYQSMYSKAVHFPVGNLNHKLTHSFVSVKVEVMIDGVSKVLDCLMITVNQIAYYCSSMTIRGGGITLNHVWHMEAITPGFA